MYDAVVVGARCAGSPTAMLLARQGYRVLVLDRATFPSDTLSTLLIHAPGVASLKRWGLLGRVVATGCPPITSYSFDFHFFAVRGTTPAVEGLDVAYAPRRTLLDAILVDAARDAGAEVREGTNVDEVLIEDGRVAGVRVAGEEIRARIVIGADGRNSRVAKSVRAEEYATKPRLQYGYYTLYSGFPTDGMETYIRPDRGFACIPTNGGLTLVVGGCPYDEAPAFKADVAGNFEAMLRAVPSVADRLERATRVEPFLGGAVPGWFRKPYGDGWALVGDAGYNKDPITAQGITDAFRDAGRCARAVDAWLRGSSYDEVMGDWHAERDAGARPIYELTAGFATLAPPPPDEAAALEAASRDPEASNRFIGVVAGVVSPTDFFAAAPAA